MADGWIIEPGILGLCSDPKLLHFLSRTRFELESPEIHSVKGFGNVFVWQFRSSMASRTAVERLRRRAIQNWLLVVKTGFL